MVQASDSIKLAVASNFSAPIKTIVDSYPRKEHKISIAYGASGKFYAQIRQGAPFDIFLSADTQKPARLISEGLAVKNSLFTYGTGKLVLWSHSPDFLQSQPPDWQQLVFHKIAMANPRTAPYGLAAQQYLQKQYPALLSSNKLVNGENIAQTLAFVKSGNAQLGFIALSQVMALPQQQRGSYWLLPETLYEPIKQDAVLLKRAKNKVAAKAFFQYLQSAEVAAMIRSFGYDTSTE